MAKQKIFYECEICKRLYEDEQQATGCETHHGEMAHLKVIDCANINMDSPAQFPEKLLLKNDEDDDRLAEYTLSRQGTITDFYHSDEQSSWC